jgi:hypothetical protein
MLQRESSITLVLMCCGVLPIRFSIAAIRVCELPSPPHQKQKERWLTLNTYTQIVEAFSFYMCLNGAFWGLGFPRITFSYPGGEKVHPGEPKWARGHPFGATECQNGTQMGQHWADKVVPVKE